MNKIYEFGISCFMFKQVLVLISECKFFSYSKWYMTTMPYVNNCA